MFSAVETIFLYSARFSVLFFS